jgi:hypothetical protein
MREDDWIRFLKLKAGCMKSAQFMQGDTLTMNGKRKVYSLLVRWVPFAAEERDFSVVNNVQKVSGARSASHPMGIGGSFPGGKVAQT